MGVSSVSARIVGMFTAATGEALTLETCPTPCPEQKRPGPTPASTPWYRRLGEKAGRCAEWVDKVDWDYERWADKVARGYLEGLENRLGGIPYFKRHPHQRETLLCATFSGSIGGTVMTPLATGLLILSGLPPLETLGVVAGMMYGGFTLFGGALGYFTAPDR